MTKKDFLCLMIGISVGSLLAISIFIFVTTSRAEIQGKQQDSCKVYYDKAKELAEKGTEDLPQGITMDFDPRVVKANLSVAYSQIYKNCKEYDGE